MIIRARVSRPDSGGVSRTDGNAADLRYLEDAAAALEPIMVVCAAAAARSSRPDVRVVARAALSVQTDQLAALSALLDEWARPGTTRPPEAEAFLGPDAGASDRVFVERLTAYTHASTAGARAELIAGASRSARLLAERAIHRDDRQLAALRALLVPGRPGDGAHPEHGATTGRRHDGGTWPRAASSSPARPPWR